MTGRELNMLKYNGRIIAKNDRWIGNYLPPIPENTIRLRYKAGTTPTFSKGTGVCIDASRNIWDLTYNNSNWNDLLRDHVDLLEVIEGTTSNVWYMGSMFNGCTSLEKVALFDTSSVYSMSLLFNNCEVLREVPLFNTPRVYNMAFMFQNCYLLESCPLFNTSNVTGTDGMFWNCYALKAAPLFNLSKVRTMDSMYSHCNITSVPLYDTSSVIHMDYAFADCHYLESIPLFNTANVQYARGTLRNCYKVESGALALYQQLSSQTTPPSVHTNTFMNCGRDTVTGAAELAQIPSDWK